MSEYEQEIERINDKMKKLERDGIILDADLLFNKQQKTKKNKWIYDCLKLYKNILDVINHLGIIDKDSFIHPFHESRLLNDDNSFNIHNFHEYIKKDEEGLFNKLLAHPEKPLQLHSEIREALNNFIDTVEKEPQPIIVKYEKMVYEPVELQKELKRIIEDENKKTETPLIKISKEYLDLFINDDYYNQVENFFNQMYNFCTNDKEYKYSIKDERDKKSLIEKNKLDFLQFLFVFFLSSSSYNLNKVLDFSYPIYKKLGKIDIIAKSAYNNEGYSTEDDENYKEARETLVFFSGRNRSNFFETTETFIKKENIFYNGKIIYTKELDKIRAERFKAIREFETAKNNEEKSKADKKKKEAENEIKEASRRFKAAKAVEDLYQKQENYKSIDSIFKFDEIKICSNKLNANMKSIKEKLEQRYKTSEHQDISELVIELLKKQKKFFKINNSEIPQNLDDEYFSSFDNNISKEEKYEKLGGKYNPEGLNEALQNFETIVYNTAARVSDPRHFSEKLTEDYYKQLTVFYPEVYSFVQRY